MRALAQMIRDFKGTPLEERLRRVGPVIKAFQAEVDALTCGLAPASPAATRAGAEGHGPAGRRWGSTHDELALPFPPPPPAGGGRRLRRSRTCRYIGLWPMLPI